MPTNLQPKSTVSAVVLPSTGTLTDVENSLSYGIYTSDAFISGAVDQVSYTYNKLGGRVLDLEITPSIVYNSYEEACLELEEMFAEVEEIEGSCDKERDDEEKDESEDEEEWEEDESEEEEIDEDESEQDESGDEEIEE